MREQSTWRRLTSYSNWVPAKEPAWRFGRSSALTRSSRWIANAPATQGLAISLVRLMHRGQHCQVDAVIAVDALYHARDFAAVLQRIGQHLTPSGRWAMTTLEINPALSGTEKRALALQLRACRIAWAGVWHGSTDIFHAAGLQISGVEDLSEAVLSGFAEAIGHRAKAVRWIDTCHPAWVKLSLTARLCRHLVNSGKVRYVLISGNAARR